MGRRPDHHLLRARDGPPAGQPAGIRVDLAATLQHCATPTNCHTHPIQSWPGVTSGSFDAPDHEYPSYLDLELVATDATGLTRSVVRRFNPRTVDVTVATSPAGLRATLGGYTGAAPFTRKVIEGSTTTVSAPTPQVLGITNNVFSSWSDGGAANTYRDRGDRLDLHRHLPVHAAPPARKTA